MNWIDTAISFISPSAGLERARKRLALETMRSYDAATRGRRGASFRQSTEGSVNQSTLPQLKILRQRSRDLVRNNPSATNAIRVISNRVVGTGIRPSFFGLIGNAEKEFKQLWKDWAESTACDFDGRLTLYGVQKLVIRTVAESGSCLIVRRRVRGNVPIQLQVLEPDYLDTSKDTSRAVGEGYIMGGIEFDKDGKRIKYHVFSTLPSDTGMVSSEAINADDVAHVFDVLRPGQVDGVPFGVSAFMKMRDLDDYEDAQLMKQKVAACLSVIVTDTAESFGATGGKTLLPDRLEPGAILNAGSGQDVTVVNPPSTEGYSDYTRGIKHDIAAGYGVTYASMTGDLTQVNFSSGKMGENNLQMLVEDLQLNMMVPQFCDRVFQWFYKAADMKREVSKGVTCTWTTPRRMMIDPTKEIKAINDAVRAGFGSWSEVVREMGYDPEELKAQMKADSAMWAELGLMPTSDPRFDATRPIPAAAPPKQ